MMDYQSGWEWLLCATLDRQHPRELYLTGHPRHISELLEPRLQDFRGRALRWGS